MPCPEVDPADVDADHLSAFLSEREGSYRVGRYFEALVEYWLRHVRKLEITAASMQLKDGKVTVGEIDFLYRDEEGVLVHCEAAVKFFLCVPGHSPSEFPGPNANDNYEAKLTKLFDKQLGRSEQYVPEVESRLGIMKGMLFYRQGDPEVAAPPRLSPTHQRGGWLRVNELDSLSDDGFVIATKPHWLAPQIDSVVLSKDELGATLTTHFAQTDQPVMVSCRGADDHTMEINRLFVVDTAWPEQRTQP